MSKRIVATPTLSLGAYADGDAIGGKLEFEDVRTPYENSGNILSLMIKDNDSEKADMVLVLFSQDFTATADNAEFDPSDADLLNCIGVMEIDDYIEFKDNSVAIYQEDHPHIHFELVEGGTSLFGQLVADASTPTYTAVNDLRVELVIE